MEERKRTVLAVAIACVVVLALMYSFGLNLLSRAPEFELADPTETASASPGTGDPDGTGGVAVAVTPETVQSVIASLSKYRSYSRTLSLTYCWGEDGRSTLSARVWVHGSWVRTDLTRQSGVTECSITNGETRWIWYTGEQEAEGRVYSGAAQPASADLIQHIPSYEDVLAIPAGEITAAGYEQRDGQSCIYVETAPDALGCVRRFWIAEDSGLLMTAQTEQDGSVVYEMVSSEVMSPMTDGAQAFTLPDGTNLYEAD